ncbi:MAG TPA: SDR family oxidoreductase [Acidimicrobiales bacterium]|jgi:NAD(P)-dependent dehydrogenase (short-subunit alcohol dehydrogenase family)|nr:SDR family oxidoreductase [Acidimicrobiales bacterium]
MAQDLQGKTFIVTGANSGIGRATAVELARRGGKVFIASRNEEKTRPVLDEIGENAAYLHLDLGDLDSVRECAAKFLALDEPLHCLVNNAGVAGQRGVTASGFELTFGTNHVGPFLFTNLLADKLKASAPARIVIVSSVAHYSAPGINYEAIRKKTRSITGLPEYAVSKLANVLHAQELARRLEGTGVTSYSLHPGAIASNVWRRIPWPVDAVMKLFMKSNEEGAQTSLYCATDRKLATESGKYYDDCAEKDPSKRATPELGAELWAKSEEWTGS